ncbi:uncharacterized protein [Dermacentor albipictus]|uniref:uncharacterized protein n=1 Tax=Dermacentor albipictus TaxID=60249 RepID=UPI0038FD34D3
MAKPPLLPLQVCETTPWRGRLRGYLWSLVGSCPSLRSSVKQLISNLRCLPMIRSHPRVNLAKSCSANAADSGFFLSERSACNKSLRVVNIELREGRLAAACLCRGVVPAAYNLQPRRSFVLVHWLLMDCRSINFVGLCEWHMSPNQFLFQNEFQLSRKLRHAKLCHHLLDDYSPRNLTDSLRYSVTALNMLETGSVRFSNVGFHEASEMPDRFQAMRVLVFLENRNDVSDGEALIRCCATHRGQREMHDDKLIKGVNFCYVLSELVFRSVVIKKLVMSRCAPGKHTTPHVFVTLTGSRAIIDRCELLGKLETQNFEENDADVRNLSGELRVSANGKTPMVSCAAASLGLQLSVHYGNANISGLVARMCRVIDHNVTVLLSTVFAEWRYPPGRRAGLRHADLSSRDAAQSYRQEPQPLLPPPWRLGVRPPRGDRLK